MLTRSFITLAGAYIGSISNNNNNNNKGCSNISNKGHAGANITSSQPSVMSSHSIHNAPPPPPLPTTTTRGKESDIHQVNSTHQHQHHHHQHQHISFTQPGLEGLRIAAYQPSSMMTTSYHSEHENQETDTVSSVTSAAAAAAAAANQIHFDRDGVDGPALQAIAVGNITTQLSDNLFAVDFHDNFLPPVHIGARIYVAYAVPQGTLKPNRSINSSSNSSSNSVKKEEEEEEEGLLMGGLVIKANGNGTLGVLLDNNRIDLAVPREKVIVTALQCRFTHRESFHEVLEWVRSAGVESYEDQLSTACVLYQRGWRAHRLYLLEPADIAQMIHLSKSTRMSLLEKAEWQRDHHRQMRSIYKERVKEKDKRYLFSKYAGIISASVAFVGAFSLFGWNYKNYLKQQRHYQMRFAVKTLTRKPRTKRHLDTNTQEIEREREERWLRQIFRQLDTAHPRVVVLTGYFGCGKSALCRSVIEKEELNAVFVDVRNREDTLRSVIKALGVPNVDACGDPLDFIADACLEAKRILGKKKTPIIVLKLREGDNLARVYSEAIALACDRRLCHLIIEVPMESLTMANASLPRLDFYTVPNFTRSQAYQYTQHTIDPLSLTVFLDVVGTNSNDLDELFAAVHQRRVSPTEYTNQKLLKAMRQLQNAWSEHEDVKAAVKRLAEFPFEEGQHEGLDETSLRHPALRDIVLYNSVQDTWLFANQSLHTAARCCM